MTTPPLIIYYIKGVFSNDPYNLCGWSIKWASTFFLNTVVTHLLLCHMCWLNDITAYYSLQCTVFHQGFKFIWTTQESIALLSISHNFYLAVLKRKESAKMCNMPVLLGDTVISWEQSFPLFFPTAKEFCHKWQINPCMTMNSCHLMLVNATLKCYQSLLISCFVKYSVLHCHHVLMAFW